MFVFGRAAKADADGDDNGGGRSTTDEASSFAFDASFLPAVTASPTDNDVDKPVTGGFKFNVPPSQVAAEGGEAWGTTPLFGSTFKSRQEVGVRVQTQTVWGLAAGCRTQTRNRGVTPTRQQWAQDTGEDKKREATRPSMFVFGNAAKADAGSDDGGRGKASSTTDGATSFAFDASFLPSITASPTDNGDDAPALQQEGFKFNVPPPQPAAAAIEGGELGDTTSLFGSSLKSRQEVWAGVKTRTVPAVPAIDSDGRHETCANCGKHGSDTVKLMDCAACRLVKYCGVDCQRAHRKQHKKVCKQRAAELEHEQLYSQGLERQEGDICQICTLPIPMPMDKHAVLEVCCMKRVCHGCDLAAQKRGMCACPFCRTPFTDNDDDKLAMVQARVLKKDPEAIHFLGDQYFFGLLGLQKDVRKAVTLWTDAAELGSIDALYDLGVAYESGGGRDKKDMVKAFPVLRKKQPCKDIVLARKQFWLL
ncbi:hypothetical protein THAOC_12569 [Thalassiosira oceanica]|uniref:MYND-type domain-containing protein n=1 Tax=Thalassiosira oceanica TaxID=159749 RepID=K0SMC0_THAOC|nr:hypothetical protein THAOC_12569 [Thalassiosira oceanica]|eukprot:EJK66510.1 hypothetical protein THAOC_12569 [Thalassiosira oceanica]